MPLNFSCKQRRIEQIPRNFPLLKYAVVRQSIVGGGLYVYLYGGKQLKFSKPLYYNIYRSISPGRACQRCNKPV